MSTYSNEPQQNKWETWFIISIILFLSIMFWGIYNNPQNLPTYYNSLSIVISINLIYCITIGLKK